MKASVQERAAYDEVAAAFGNRKGWSAPRHIGGGYFITERSGYAVTGTKQGMFSVVLGGRPIADSLPLFEAVKQVEALVAPIEAAKAKAEAEAKAKAEALPEFLGVNTTTPDVKIEAVGHPTPESGHVETKPAITSKSKRGKR